MMDKPVLPLSRCFDAVGTHAHNSEARNHRIAERMALHIGAVATTSATWYVMAQA